MGFFPGNEDAIVKLKSDIKLCKNPIKKQSYRHPLSPFGSFSYSRLGVRDLKNYQNLMKRAQIKMSLLHLDVQEISA